MDSLQKIACDKSTWLGVLALALTIAAELLTEAGGSTNKADSFVEQERMRRAVHNVRRPSR